MAILENWLIFQIINFWNFQEFSQLEILGIF